jgi:hypothetical protein
MPNSTTATALAPEQIENLMALRGVVGAYPFGARYDPDNARHRLLFVGLDGTAQDRAASPADLDSNVAQLARLMEAAGVASVYVPGVASSPSPAQLLGELTGEGVIDQAERAYLAIARQARVWLDELPDADIHIVLSGFSRGAAAAVHLTNLIAERGIVDPASARTVVDEDLYGERRGQLLRTVYDQTLIAPGAARIDGLLAIDTVATGQRSQLMLTIPPVVDSVLHLVADDEPRLSFRLDSLTAGLGDSADARLMEVWLDGAHSDLGGGYDHGLSAVYLQFGLDYVNAVTRGMAGAMPPDMAVTDPLVVHDPSLAVGRFLRGLGAGLGLEAGTRQVVYHAGDPSGAAAPDGVAVQPYDFAAQALPPLSGGATAQPVDLWLPATGADLQMPDWSLDDMFEAESALGLWLDPWSGFDPGAWGSMAGLAVPDGADFDPIIPVWTLNGERNVWPAGW